jgi:hypothetical protein
MSGVATAIAIGGSAVIGAGASMSSAGKAGKAARDAASKQEAMSAKELAFRQAMYDHEKQMTQPLRQKLTDEAMSSEPLDYAGTSAKIKQGYAEAKRRLAESGYGAGTAGTGVGATNAQALDLGEASDLAGAWTQGMSAKRGLGTTMMGYGNFANTQNALANSMSANANYYGHQADKYGQAAQQGWQNAANAAGGIVSGIARYFASKEESPSAETDYQRDDWTQDLPQAPYGANPSLPSPTRSALDFMPNTGYRGGSGSSNVEY